MATEKHSAHAPASSTAHQLSKVQSKSVEVLDVPTNAVVLVTCKVTPSAIEIQDTVATVRQLFPKNKVLIVNGNINVSLLTDDQLRSLGLARIQ